MIPIPSPLLVVTDRHQATQPLEEIVAEAVSAGARWVWFRDRDMETAERRRLALRLLEIVRGGGGRLSVGADIELAAEAGGDAHVRDIQALKEARRRLGQSALIGLSAHTLSEVADARAADADYVTLSPIYETASKPGYGPTLGAEAIARAAQTGIPVLALGGVTAGTVCAVRAKGAAGVAVMGEVMRAEKPRAVVEDLLRRLS